MQRCDNQQIMNQTITAYRAMPKQTCVAREGFPFILIAFIAAFILFAAGFVWVFALALCVALFVVFFFRNPERVIPEEEGVIVSPADGRVLSVDREVTTPHTGKRATRISIFMSVFNVHVNRFPISATVKRIFYHSGKFFVASLNKASEKNERNILVLEDEKGREFVMVQIAGLIARRIVCYFKDGDSLQRGMRFGLIRFGSRVDLYLPDEADVRVEKGDRVHGGSSILGRMK